MSDRSRARSTPRRWRRMGLRREVLILVPAAFFLVVLLSLFTLLTYRNAVSLLVEERRAEAVALAGRLAGEIAGSASPESRLRQAVVGARGVALVEAGGGVRARIGALPEGPLLAPLGAEPVPVPRVLGPDADTGGAVVAFVPLGRSGGGSPAWLRVDLGATALAAQQRNLTVLTWVVVGADGALGLLVVLFLGHMLAPYESLLERAREGARHLGAEPGEPEDEVAFLLDTFERALEGLARRPEGEDDEIAILQRTLGVSLESGVLLLDRSGAVLALNETGAGLLGVPHPDAGTPIHRLAELHPGLAAPVALIEEAVASGREVRREECRIGAPAQATAEARPGAADRTLGLTVHPLRREATGTGGEPRGFLVLFVDLTEVRRQRERAQLAESLRQLGELAAGVAHELRNSLATIKGYLGLIERETGGGGDAEEDGARDLPESLATSLAEIGREADHLHRVLEDFLTFARPGSARLEPVDLGLVAERAAADPSLGAGGPPRIEIVHAGGPASATISGDPQLLERALRNLLHNAVQAGRETGDDLVEVTVHADPDRVVLTVADRGPGIPSGIRDRLFEPFATGRPDGLGLGLALTHRILSLHGAELRMDDREGGGTLAVTTFSAHPPD